MLWEFIKTAGRPRGFSPGSGFIELPPFAELRDELFSDEGFLSLQMFLSERPEAGDVIPKLAVAANCGGRLREKASEAARE